MQAWIRSLIWNIQLCYLSDSDNIDGWDFCPCWIILFYDKSGIGRAISLYKLQDEEGCNGGKSSCKRIESVMKILLLISSLNHTAWFQGLALYNKPVKDCQHWSCFVLLEVQ